MSAPKHTPGPWRWTENGRLGSVNTAESRSIAVILNSDGCMVYRDAADGWDDEQAANLALIAAAPDLLEAMKKLLWVVTDEGRLDAGEFTPYEWDAAVVAANRAIIKAEGGDL